MAVIGGEGCIPACTGQGCVYPSMHWAGGVSARGVSEWGGGVCPGEGMSVGGGVSVQEEGGVCIPACTGQGGYTFRPYGHS